MSRPARLKPGQPDLLSDAFALAYKAGESFRGIAARFDVNPQRVARTLKRRRGFVQRGHSEACLLPHKPALDRVADLAREQLAAMRPPATFTLDKAALGTSHSLHLLRAQARRAGPPAGLVGMPRLAGFVWADEARIAAAHAAGLTLDDIAEVFAVEPREAARAIAAHAGR